MTSTPLPTAVPATVTAVLERVARHRHELLDRVRYTEDSRWHQLLSPTESGATDVEVWLLSWLPGQESALHDHGGSSGAFSVLFGSLDETVVSSRSGASSEHLWTPGQVRSFGEHHIHRVGNDASTPAVSLHVYAPSLSRMTRYVRTDSGLVPLSVENAGTDW